MDININSKQDFIEFLESHPEKGNAWPEAEFYKAHVIHPEKYHNLKALKLSFEEYRNFWLYVHPQTNELFLGERNDGGIAFVCYVVRIHRDDILNKPDYMNGWYYVEGYLSRYK